MTKKENSVVQTAAGPIPVHADGSLDFARVASGDAVDRLLEDAERKLQEVERELRAEDAAASRPQSG